MKELAGGRAVERTVAIDTAVVITASGLAVGFATKVVLVVPLAVLGADLLDLFSSDVAATVVANTIFVEDSSVELRVDAVNCLHVRLASSI